MAVYRCPDCGGKVSERANACINCGCPIDVVKSKGELYDFANTTSSQETIIVQTPAPRPSYPPPPKSCYYKPEKEVVVVENGGNGCGTSGFVLAILGFLFVWIPLLGQILWFLGALLSFIGLFKSPRTLAVLGLVISYFWYMVFAAFAAGVMSFLDSILS
jgi:DNA-directed RNA polymerase subunit RPC12/RpoP